MPQEPTQTAPKAETRQVPAECREPQASQPCIWGAAIGRVPQPCSLGAESCRVHHKPTLRQHSEAPPSWRRVPFYCVVDWWRLLPMFANTFQDAMSKTPKQNGNKQEGCTAHMRSPSSGPTQQAWHTTGQTRVPALQPHHSTQILSIVRFPRSAARQRAGLRHHQHPRAGPPQTSCRRALAMTTTATSQVPAFRNQPGAHAGPQPQAPKLPAPSIGRVVRCGGHPHRPHCTAAA